MEWAQPHFENGLDETGQDGNFDLLREARRRVRQ